MDDLSIWCCSYRDIKADTVQCLEYFRRETTLSYTFNIISGDALIGRSRSIAATQFLKNSLADYLIFIDDDIIFQTQDIEIIHKNMRNNYEVIGGCYALRDGKGLAQSNNKKIIVLDGGIHEIEYASTGFMGITRNALDKVILKCNLPLLHEGHWAEDYPFFESGQYTEDKIYLSEDWNFCDKVRTAGLKVYLNTTVQVGHIGEKIYRIKDLIK